MTGGALSMAAGEYVSVSSQRDSERADLRLEARELTDDPEGELRELALIHQRRGLPADVAREVAQALSERDALGAHARDELGLATQRLVRSKSAAWPRDSVCRDGDGTSRASRSMSTAS
jgi:VIT1/CCC1 family predicted Fe2+/Mn2+ transporter